MLVVVIVDDVQISMNVWIQLPVHRSVSTPTAVTIAAVIPAIFWKRILSFVGPPVGFL